MKTNFFEITKSTFKWRGMLACFIGDLLICTYLWQKYTDRIEFTKALKNVKALGGFNQMTPEFSNQIYILLVQTLVVMFAVILIFHMLVYLLYHFEKKSAYLYIKCLVYVGVPGSLLLGISGLFSGSTMEALFIVQGGLYLYVLLGPRHFPQQKN